MSLDEPARVARCAVVLIRTGTVDEAGLNEWSNWGEAGPLALTVDGRRRVAADSESRATYLGVHTQGIVLDQRVRRHALCANDPALADFDLRPWAREMVIGPKFSNNRQRERRLALVLSHHSPRIDGGPLEALERSATAIANELSFVPPGFVPECHRGVDSKYHLVMATLTDARWPSFVESATQPPNLYWAAAFAGLTYPETEVPGGSKLDDFDFDDEWLEAHVNGRNYLHPSATWDQLVFRNGLAALGRQPDHGNARGLTAAWMKGECASAESFLDYAELYCRTIFSDAVMLGEVQRALIQQLHDDVGTDSGSVATYERSLRNLRTKIWWREAGSAGQANAILRAFQDENGLAERLQQLSSDVGERAESARLELGLRTSGALSIITAVGLPLAGALSAAQILSPPVQSAEDRFWTLVLALVGAAILAGALLAVFPGLRSSVADALRERSKK